MLLVISFHFMNVIDPLRKSLRQMLPERADREVDRIGTQINAMLGQYLRGIVLISILVSLGATVLLTVVSLFFGTKYSLILGLITSVTYLIPYIGPIISVLSAGFFGYVTAAQTPWIACGVSILAVLIVNQLFDTFFTPRIVGQRVGLHPLVMLFAVFTGVALLGIPGMIIATPVAASIKIVLARWLPIKQIDFTAPSPNRRLDIDVGASLDLLSRNVARIRHDVETALRHEGRQVSAGEAPAPDPEQETLPLEKTEQTPDQQDG